MNDEIPMNNSNSPRDSTSPSSANQSFVKNVATRVSGLIPKSITKWFQTQDNGLKRNGSALMQDPNDFSSDEESVVTSHPPRKKLCLNQNEFSNSTHCRETTIRETQTFSESDLPQPIPSTSSFSSFTTIHKEVKPQSPKEMSLPAVAEEIYTPKRKSLLFPRGKVPQVNISDTSLDNTLDEKKMPPKTASYLSGSPYYSGKTMYGGAGAHPLAYSLINKPNIVTRKRAIVKPALNNEDNTMSQAAKKILEVLEKCSSPVNEAKRLPSLSLFSNVKADRTFTPQYSPYCQKPHFLQDLHVSNIPTLLSIKRAKMIDSTLAARQIVASKSSSEGLNYNRIRNNVKLPETKSNSKPKRLAIRRGDTKNAEFEIEPPLELPKGTLNVDSTKLPTFNFIANHPPKQTGSAEAEIKDTPKGGFFKSALGKDPEPLPPLQNSFSFSSPPKISRDKLSSQSSSNEFVFSLPQKHGVNSNRSLKNTLETYAPFQDTVAKNKTNYVSPVNKHDTQICDTSKSLVNVKSPKSGDTAFAALLKKQSEKWECKSCLTRNDMSATKCVCCQEPNTQKIDTGFKNIVKEQISKWECSSCMTRNEENKTKCVCCETPNPNASKKADSVFGDLVKQQSSKWECSSCMTRNDNDKDKCVCCETSRPNQSMPQDSTFAAILNDQKSKWVCKSCMMRNETNALKCVCCEEPNPNNLTKKDTSFTKILNEQKSKWECNSCMTRNEPSAAKCVCCEEPAPGQHVSHESEKSSPFAKSVTSTKPTFSSTPLSQFKFGIQPNSADSKSAGILSFSKPEAVTSAAKPATSESGLPKFSFGIPSATSENKSLQEEKKASEPVKFSFGAPSKTEGTKTAENKAAPSADNNATTFFPPVTTPISQNASSVAITFPTLTKPETTLPTLSFPTVSQTAVAATNITFPPLSPSTSKIPISTLPSDSKPIATTTSSPPTLFPAVSFTGLQGNKQTTATFSLSKPLESTASGTATTAPGGVFTFSSNAQPNLTTVGTTLGTTTQPADKKFNFSLPTQNTSLYTLGSTTTNTSLNATPTLSNTTTFPLSNDTTDGASKANTTAAFSAPVFGFGTSAATKDTPAPKFNFSLNKPTDAPFTFGTSLPKPAAPVTEKKPEVPSMFGVAKAPENIFGASNPSNHQAPMLFGQPMAASEAPKPFFGATAQTFGSSATPMFGSGMANNSNLFANVNNRNNANENKPAALFGASSTPPTFGTPTANPPFAMNQPPPKFELPQMTSTPPPAFNFGAQTPPSFGFTGFGQQQKTTPQSGVYTFGASPGGPVQTPTNMQFNIGSFTGSPQSSVIANRKVRKVIRRNPN